MVGHKFGEFASTQKHFSSWEKSFALEDDGYSDVKK
jgi:ribosomal protein S19